jgi:hypothetical protein
MDRNVKVNQRECCGDVVDVHEVAVMFTAEWRGVASFATMTPVPGDLRRRYGRLRDGQ